MSEEQPFVGLMARVRAGDGDAAAELERVYGPAIRREIRLRMRNRRVVGSDDICQSVMRSFFVRAALGQFDLDKPAQLTALLKEMARNRLIDQTRRQQAQRRDERRNQPLEGADGHAMPIGDPAPSPSRVVAWRELYQRFLDKLPAKERELAERRAQGREWADIAAELGGTPDALRMRFQRAINQLAPELGLDE